ncbi:general secretion pathway protein I [Candidatus Photodesmus katoptron]|uniref:Type II secretion system protein I n=1 Tax=Candidatus Photodesmus katoptron Akat1 TaxID=1236703 RepID=S3DZY7_9GAMM|nr:type II secretion system minor pseudopilin GspI [Candidatus Photodesmus katoptron]EPE37531.1 general secretion pathway protein I [Candidatus Photodesmus katoptron Akat1]KEY90181.1 general secretion pathway protein I [Candidatus Photodesmus katoptron]
MTNYRGMTFIEVLIALTIFSSTSIAVLQLVNHHINTMNYLEEKTFAVIIINNKIAQVMLHPTSLIKVQGIETIAGQIWHWKIEPIQTSNNLLQAFEVSVSKNNFSSTILTMRSYVANQNFQDQI